MDKSKGNSKGKSKGKGKGKNKGNIVQTKGLYRSTHGQGHKRT